MCYIFCMNYLVVLGTVRKGRYSKAVADFIVKTAKKNYPKEHFELLDIKDLNLSLNQEGSKLTDTSLIEKLKSTHGFIFVFPEYNHSFPASLKLFIDLWDKDRLYLHKTCACVGVSSGRYGGTRAIESFINVARALGMFVTYRDANITKVQEEFKNSVPENPKKWENLVTPMLEELVKVTNLLIK